MTRIKLHANSSGLTQEDLETFTLVPKALVKFNADPEIKKDCSDFIKTDSTNEEAAHENATDHLESLKANRNQTHATHQMMHGIHMIMMQHIKMSIMPTMFPDLETNTRIAIKEVTTADDASKSSSLDRMIKEIEEASLYLEELQRSN
eukprot:scaffold100719_cov25-Cyclotella_meneghiniana.AAC.1